MCVPPFVVCVWGMEVLLCVAWIQDVMHGSCGQAIDTRFSLFKVCGEIGWPCNSFAVVSCTVPRPTTAKSTMQVQGMQWWLGRLAQPLATCAWCRDGRLSTRVSRPPTGTFGVATLGCAHTTYRLLADAAASDGIDSQPHAVLSTLHALQLMGD